MLWYPQYAVKITEFNSDSNKYLLISNYEIFKNPSHPSSRLYPSCLQTRLVKAQDFMSFPMPSKKRNSPNVPTPT